MVFSSVFFVWIFLPIVLFLYYLSSFVFRNDDEKRIKASNLLLLAASILFYGLGGYRYLFLLLFVLVINFFGGIVIGKGFRIVLIPTVALDIAILSFFKFSDTFTDIVLPLGISFYMFQSMSYVIDVYRGYAVVQKSFIRFSLYVSLFPQLVAGPIVKYSDIEKQLSKREVGSDKFFDGVIRFCFGMGKKVLIANTLAEPVDAIWGTNIKGLGAGVTWFGALCYILQLYFDFSGYSDMAIGLGKMFGFEFKENFEHPYSSTSIQEFWRRWHISLSNWFKEYVYIPLGGNRKGLPRQCLNLLIVWMLTGLWHGASLNFVIWGLYYAVILIIEKLFLGKVLSGLPGIFRHIYALLIVAFGWGIFYFTDFGQFTLFVNRLVTYSADEKDIINWMIAYLPTAAVAVLASTKLYYRFVRSLRKSRFMFLEIPILAVLFVLCVSALVSQSYNPFIYFRF